MAVECGGLYFKFFAPLLIQSFWIPYLVFCKNEKTVVGHEVNRTEMEPTVAVASLIVDGKAVAFSTIVFQSGCDDPLVTSSGCVAEPEGDTHPIWALLGRQEAKHFRVRGRHSRRHDLSVVLRTCGRNSFSKLQQEIQSIQAYLKNWGRTHTHVLFWATGIPVLNFW